MVGRGEFWDWREGLAAQGLAPQLAEHDAHVAVAVVVQLEPGAVEELRRAAPAVHAARRVFLAERVTEGRRAAVGEPEVAEDAAQVVAGLRQVGGGCGEGPGGGGGGGGGGGRLAPRQGGRFVAPRAQWR